MKIGHWSLLRSVRSCQGPTAWALTTGANCCSDQLLLVKTCAQCGQGFGRMWASNTKSANWESTDKNKVKKHQIGQALPTIWLMVPVWAKVVQRVSVPFTITKEVLPLSSALLVSIPRTTRRT